MPRASLWQVNVLFSIGCLLAISESAEAGMPSVRLSDLGALRIQAISFFLLVFFLGSWVIQLIWNSLRREFPLLPRLGYFQAVGLATLWGLLFVLVLTMISGARELLTPGAWEPNGATYQLKKRPSGPTAVVPELSHDDPAARREKLTQLRTALWLYAAAHDGRFPADDTDAAIADEFWRTTSPAGVRYLYFGGEKAHVRIAPLVLEPRLFQDEQFVLFTNGEIRQVSATDLDSLVAAESGR